MSEIIKLTNSEPPSSGGYENKEPPSSATTDASITMDCSEENKTEPEPPTPVTHKGKLLIDATACPQDIRALHL